MVSFHNGSDGRCSLKALFPPEIMTYSKELFYVNGVAETDDHSVTELIPVTPLSVISLGKTTLCNIRNLTQGQECF